MMIYLLFAEYPLRLLVDVVEVVAIGGLIDSGTTLCVGRFPSPHVWENEKTLLQDAQKGRPSQPPNPGGYFTRPP